MAANKKNKKIDKRQTGTDFESANRSHGRFMRKRLHKINTTMSSEIVIRSQVFLTALANAATESL